MYCLSANQGAWLTPARPGVNEFKWSHRNYLCYKLENADWAEDELQTWNCTLQYLSKKNGCLCEAQTHDLHIRTRHSSDETTCTLNSFYLVFIVLILHSHQVSIFMKQPRSTHNRFCSAKKKKVIVFVRFELMTFTL